MYDEIKDRMETLIERLFGATAAAHEAESAPSAQVRRSRVNPM
jgi:hypothetical protein